MKSLFHDVSILGLLHKRKLFLIFKLWDSALISGNCNCVDANITS